MSKYSSLFEYCKSSIITFISMFAMAVLPMIGDASFTKASLFALLTVGVRAGVKALLESLSVIHPTVTVTPISSPAVDSTQV